MLGRLLGVQDAGGAIWSYSYDLLGNRLTASDPDLGNWSYAYDAASHLISQTDARGFVSSMSYDQMGRLILQTSQAPDGSPAVTVAKNTYDQNPVAGSANIGLLTRSENAAAVRTFDKHLTGSGSTTTTATTIDGVTQTTVEVKDALDTNTLSKSYGPVNVAVGSSSAPWTYNADNLLYSIPGYITSITYQADGQTSQITYANGVTTTFAYSVTRNWLTRVTTAKGSTVLMDDQYTRDNLGRIKTITG